MKKIFSTIIIGFLIIAGFGVDRYNSEERKIGADFHCHLILSGVMAADGDGVCPFHPKKTGARHR